MYVLRVQFDGFDKFIHLCGYHPSQGIECFTPPESTFMPLSSQHSSTPNPSSNSPDFFQSCVNFVCSNDVVCIPAHTITA